MPKAEDTMPSLTGYPKTQRVIQIRQTPRERGDGMQAARGIFRGFLLGAALWGIVAVVAFTVVSTGDARNDARPHTTVTVDRGGHH
jgi:hypothetical protein